MAWALPGAGAPAQLIAMYGLGGRPPQLPEPSTRSKAVGLPADFVVTAALDGVSANRTRRKW